MKTVFDRRGIGDAPVGPVERADLHRCGLDKMAQLGREGRVDIAAHPVLGALSRAFPFFIDGVIEYAMGDIWTRQGLDIATRQIVTIAAFAAPGDAWPQVKLHTGRALRAGVPRQTLAEVANLLTLAVGFHIALNAAAAVQGVFVEFDATHNV